MPKWSETIERHRPSLLAVIMGALLLLSVALAGVLIALRGGARQEGTDILLGIRQKKLPAFWGNDGVNLWYLWTGPDGRPAGWWTATRGLKGRGYEGKRIERRGAFFSREVWQVDRDGQGSQYLAQVFDVIRQPGKRNSLIRPASNTTIILRDGQVQVKRTGPGASQIAQDAPPANYVPEGLTELAFYLASQAGQRATFAHISNDAAVADGRLYFSRVTATPHGKSKVALSFQSLRGQFEESMEFDGKGEILRGGFPDKGLTFERTTADVVKKTFPDAELFLKREAEEAPED